MNAGTINTASYALSLPTATAGYQKWRLLHFFYGGNRRKVRNIIFETNRRHYSRKLLMLQRKKYLFITVFNARPFQPIADISY